MAGIILLSALTGGNSGIILLYVHTGQPVPPVRKADLMGLLPVEKLLYLGKTTDFVL